MFETVKRWISRSNCMSPPVRVFFSGRRGGQYFSYCGGRYTRV